jgi:hypothetical protein
LVIDANRSENRGEKLGRGNPILGDIGAIGIGAAVNNAATNAATRQGHAPASSPVISPAHGVDLWSSPHFRERDDERVLDETTLLQIFKERRHDLVEIGHQRRVDFEVLAMGVPPAAIQANKRHTRFDEATSNERLLSEERMPVTVANTLWS